MKPYLLLMYLNDLVRTHNYFNRELSSELTKFMEDTIDKLSLKDINKLLKRYIFLSNKRKLFNMIFTSNSKLSWFTAEIIAYLDVFLPIVNFKNTILQKIENECHFNELSYEEIYEVSDMLDKIIDKL